MKLVIGSAQFGLNYGITNKNGKVNKCEVKNILKLAYKNGINTIDTATGYGECESVLGSLKIDNWNIITKIKPLEKNVSNIHEAILNQVKQSMINLKKNMLYGVLLHKPLELIEKNGHEIWNSLNVLKNKNIVKKVGFSIYNPDELEILWDNGYYPDIVQAPYNVFDRRLKTSGWLLKLKNAKAEIHVRSIFLQGLLLTNLRDLPKFFCGWEKHFMIWENWLKDNNISKISAALNFVLSENLIDKVIVGVDNKEQLLDILNDYNSFNIKFPEYLEFLDERLLNPYNWELN